MKSPAFHWLWRHGSVSFLVGLVLVGNAAAWLAAGKVLDSQGAPLPGVLVSVGNSTSDDSAITDATGAFRLGGEALSALPRKGGDRSISATMSGNEWTIRGLWGGPAELSLIDGSGRQILTTRAFPDAGVVRIPAPRGLQGGKIFLRVVDVGGARVQSLVIGTGEAPTDLGGRSAARTASAGRILRFRKTGYRDTTQVISQDTALGLSVVMSSSPGASLPGTWIGDTTYFAQTGVVTMGVQVQVKLAFGANHEFSDTIAGVQAFGEPVRGDLFRGTGTWTAIGSDSIRVQLTSCTQPDTGTIPIATFPAVLPFHEEGLGTNVAFVINPHKATPCPAAGTIWIPWQETLSVRLPVKMVAVQDSLWELSVIRQ